MNGPALFERGGERYRHWLDGDGMIQSLHFNGNEVHFASRFVRTRKFVDEEVAGRFIYRAFGTAFKGDRLRRSMMLEPPVNVSVYPFAGTLLAFGEQGLPMELDPHTLETKGEFDFCGALNEISPFAAHAKIDPVSGHLLNFGISFSPAQSLLNLYEVDEHARLIWRRRHPLRLPNCVHDFGITEKYAVFHLAPLLLQVDRFRQEGLSLMDSLTWEPDRGSSILILPRNGVAEEPRVVPCGAGYCLHLINCHENDGRLIIDVIELKTPVYSEYQPIPDLFANVAPGRPVRFSIDLTSQQVIERIELAYDGTPDFPAMNARLYGQLYDEFWMLGISSCGKPGRKFFDQLVHARWSDRDLSDIYRAPRGEYLAGEPIFVEDSCGTGDGVVIVEHLDTRTDTASFVLFDAFQISRGPIARLFLRHRIHPGFHACFRREHKFEDNLPS